jgi:hypothetical protein
MPDSWVRRGFTLVIIGAVAAVTVVGQLARLRGGFSGEAWLALGLALSPYFLFGALIRLFRGKRLSPLLFGAIAVAVAVGALVHLDALVTPGRVRFSLFPAVAVAQLKFGGAVLALAALGLVIHRFFRRQPKAGPDGRPRTWMGVMSAAAEAFPDVPTEKVLSILEMAGREMDENGRSRIQLGIIHLSGGDLDKLFEWTMTSLDDWRDVLYWAEYPPKPPEPDPETGDGAGADGDQGGTGSDPEKE